MGAPVPASGFAKLETLLNSILTYIAGILVVLLFAALVGPSLVDWNQFRDDIEAQASEAAGRPVSIDGDIRFRILPAPHMTLNKIKIGHEPNASSLPSELHFATFDEIDAEIALSPLLSGDIEVTSVLIVRPQINLEVLPDGSMNWRSLDLAGRMPAEGMFSLASISLEKASFENGTIDYRNRVNGREWKAEDVNGEVVAQSLLGPLRSEMEATIGGVPLKLRLGLGAFGGNKAFQVTAEAEAVDHPVQFLFSGVATEFSLAARLDGNGRLRIGESGEGDASGAAPLRVDAAMVVNSRRANLRSLTVNSNGSSLGGSAQIRWDKRPSFSAQLSAENFALDPVLDRFAPAADAGALNLLNALLSGQPPEWIDGSVKIETGTLTVRDVLVRDAKLDAALENGHIDIDEAKGELGGSTSVAFQGGLAPAETGSRFEGTASIQSTNMAALANWLLPPGESEEGGRAAPRGVPFAARTKLRLEPGVIAFDDIAMAYATNLAMPGLRGDVVRRSDKGRDKIDASLIIADFDFDPLISLLPETDDPFRFFNENDIGLTLKADRLTLFGREMSDAGTEMSLVSGNLSVPRLKIGDIAGATLTFSGKLDNVTTGSRDDVEAQFTSSIKAQRFGGLLEIGGFAVPDVEGPVDIAVTGTSGEADDSQSRVDTLTLQGTVRGSRVDGVLKRLHGAAGGVDRLDIVANAANNEGRVLIEQLGLSPREDLTGSGTVSVQLNGDAASGYETNFRVNVNGTTLTARGTVEKPFEALRFSGRADIAASGVMHVLGSFGAPEPLAAWIGEQASGPGFVFSSDVVWDKESLSLNEFESVAGNFRLSGNAGWRAAEGEKLPKVTGTLEANAIDLTSLVVAEDDENGVWPVDALDWSLLAGMEGDVDLKAGTVRLGTLPIGDVSTHLSLSHGVLTASPFVGSYGGGRLSVGARIEGGTGEPGIGLTVLLEEAELQKSLLSVAGVTPGKGRLDFSAQLQGQGRSWFALVSSVTGTGKIGLSDFAFEPLDIPAFSKALAEMESIDAFPSLVKEKLLQGDTEAREISGDFSVSDGVLRFADPEIPLEGGSGEAGLVYDLPRLIADADLVVTLSEPEGAPAFSLSAAGRRGRIAVETHMLALQNFVAQRLLARSIEETGAEVPDDLRDLMELPPAAEAPATPMPRPSIPN